jgi:iron(III) transport system ATP-binding protein
MLQLNAVSHSYLGNASNNLVLNNISLKVADGELACLLGASGCGKSTLLRLIAGLEKVQSGEISYQCRMLADKKTHIPAHLRNIGLVFQHPSLFPHLNVLQNIQFGLNHKPKSERTQIAKNMLQLIELEQLAYRFPHQLSGGQHQRVALARTLAPSPIIMLLDEPFANLDYNLRRNLRTQIAQTLKATNIPIILVTHDPEEALAMADSMILLGNGGTILQSGGASEVYHRPKSLEIAKFFGHINMFAGVVKGDEIHSQLGTYPKAQYAPNLPNGTNIMLCTRPEGLRIAHDGEISVLAVIEDVSYTGVGWLVNARLSEGTALQLHHIYGMRPHKGDNINITLQSPHVFIFPDIVT